MVLWQEIEQMGLLFPAALNGNKQAEAQVGEYFTNVYKYHEL